MVDILLVEDNAELCGLLCDFLRAENYTVSTADNGSKALSLFEKYGARLVLLDINLPGIDGFSVCRRIRETDNTPVIILTARSERGDKLNGINLGADDYIEKPYDIDILLAKIRGIFRRRLSRGVVAEGGIELDLEGETVRKDGALLPMSMKEFGILRLLIENKGQTVTKEQLFNRVWGAGSESEPQTLTVHIKWLREKIEDDPKQPKHIITVWGRGYRWGG